MLQKAAHKTVMHALGRTVELKCFREIRGTEVAVQKLSQIRILYRSNECQQLGIHLFDIF